MLQFAIEHFILQQIDICMRRESAFYIYEISVTGLSKINTPHNYDYILFMKIHDLNYFNSTQTLQIICSCDYLYQELIKTTLNYTILLSY